MNGELLVVNGGLHERRLFYLQVMAKRKISPEMLAARASSMERPVK